MSTITQHALVSRINRKLAHEGEALRRRRGGSYDPQLGGPGDYYVLDVNRNAVVGTAGDLEQYGRELGVLREWEKVAS